MIGGLDAFFNEAQKQEGEEDMIVLGKSPLDSEFIWTKDDSDLPDTADCGIIESFAAQMNPGQLVLAMAEQIKDLGGHIATNCKVNEVTYDQNKQVKLECTLNEKVHI